MLIDIPRIDDEDVANDYLKYSPYLDDSSASKRLGIEKNGLSYWTACIRECFEEKYNGRFTGKKDKSTISLTFEITTIENSDKISKIYPNFVHSSGALVLTDNWTQKNIYFQNIFETSGSDFNSVEKAGINSLKNLAKVVTSKICS